MGKVPMKMRILMTLCLCVALGLPALAQTNGSSSTAQTAPAAQSTTDREPLKEPRPQNFWDGDDPNLVNLVVHPFANKQYVLRHTLPIKDRLNELDEITAENKTHIKDVDASAQQGIQLASEKVSLADQHSNEALNKAQIANTAANEASTRVTSSEHSVGSVDDYKTSTETEIRFRAGESVLSKSSKNVLDRMATPLKGQRGYIIEIRGFAPGHGHTAVVNSRKMADSVRRYLVLTHKIPVSRIYVTGMGNAGLRPARGSRRMVHGRVEVNVLLNALVNTAQR